MKTTKNELWIINYVLQVDISWNTKKYWIAELAIATSVFKEIKKLIVWEYFVDWEIKLSTEQKAFLLKEIDTYSWSVIDSESVFNLKKMLA